MSIKIAESHKHNFETLRQAFNRGDIALLDVFDNVTKENKVALVAIGREGLDIVMTPFAIMIDDNPFKRYSPPSPDGEGYEGVQGKKMIIKYKYRVSYIGLLQIVVREFDKYERAIQWCRQIGRRDLIKSIERIKIWEIVKDLEIRDYRLITLLST